MQLKRIAVGAAVLLTILCAGCTLPWVYDWFPAAQSGTTWVSDDGSVVIHIPEGKPYTTTPYGTVTNGDESTDVVFSMGPQADDICVYLAEYLDELKSGQRVDAGECWQILSVRPGTFRVQIENSAWFDTTKVLLFTREES